MNYVASDACIRAATAAAGEGKLTEQEILDAFQRASDYKAHLEAQGRLTGQAERLRQWATEEAERTKIAAAMRRRHTALNVIVRTKIDEAIDGLLEAGLSPKKVMLALLEGTQKGVRGGRKSTNALRQAYEGDYLGSMLAAIQRERPHLVGVLHDQKLDDDVFREMRELRQGGQPGITGNKDAQFLAKVFADHAEMVRVELNRLGASIGKFDGWGGVQTHDDVKMIGAGKDAWVGYIAAKLDLERTFPEGVSGGEVARALGDIYDTIITGIDNSTSPAEMGQRVNPANLARSLGRSRVLHFKDAEAALAYRQEYGYGNTVSGMFSHMRNSARIAAVMSTWGPNPNVMFDAVAATLEKRVKADPALSPAQKQKQISQLNTQAGALRAAIDIATGLASRPVDVTWSKIGSDARALQSMGKLGGAVLSSFGDTISAASASQFRGSGFFTGLTRQLAGIMSGRPKAEQAEIGFLIGEGFDGLIGHIVSPQAATDGVVGKLGRMQELFFRLNGLTWWTDVGRATAARVIAAEMGMRAGQAFDQLPPQYRHVLELNGIDAARWAVIGQANLRNVNGQAYVTPDRIRAMPDEAFMDIFPARIAAARGDPERIAYVIQDARRDVELSLRRFIADETNYGVIKTDAKTQRWMTVGHRPGTFAGEAMRFIMQFKGFPLAFTDRVIGRALFGHRKDASKLERFAHIGALLGGLTMAGYASMTAKDIVKGYWPPRDPADPRTWLAAAQQGGAWGIYGDFLFSQTNRFGGGIIETAAGPTLGSAGELFGIYNEAMLYGLDKASGDEGRFSASNTLNWALGNVPGLSLVNLFYLKPAMDYLWLNSLRETLAPGTLRRQERTRQREYGQERYLPATMMEQ